KSLRGSLYQRHVHPVIDRPDVNDHWLGDTTNRLRQLRRVRWIVEQFEVDAVRQHNGPPRAERRDVISEAPSRIHSQRGDSRNSSRNPPGVRACPGKSVVTIHYPEHGWTIRKQLKKKTVAQVVDIEQGNLLLQFLVQYPKYTGAPP